MVLLDENLGRRSGVGAKEVYERQPEAGGSLLVLLSREMKIQQKDRWEVVRINRGLFYICPWS